MTDKGGKTIAKITLNNDIVTYFYFAKIMIFLPGTLKNKVGYSIIFL